MFRSSFIAVLAGTNRGQIRSKSASDSADALEKLAKLHVKGVLIHKEFQQKKTELLVQM